MSTVLTARNRKNERRSQLTDLRRQGNVPAIVYGYQVGNTPISVNGAEFTKTMREVGRNGVISLDLEGKSVNVILHEYQEDPLKGTIIHADFLAVNMAQEIEANVRVELSEDSIGVSNGGVLQQILHELSITAKPNEIPELISVDVASLQIGESISIADIRKNYSITINHEDDETIANVAPPRTEEDRTDEESADSPEVIGENTSAQSE